MEAVKSIFKEDGDIPAPPRGYLRSTKNSFVLASLAREERSMKKEAKSFHEVETVEEKEYWQNEIPF